jgi:subtilisin family serine protease
MSIIIFIAVLFVTAIIFPGRAFAFADVAGHWARLDIDLLASHGAIKGYPTGLFLPNNHISRAEFAKVLIVALNKEDEVWALKPVPAVFRDVDVHHWARGYIQLAYELGIVKGHADGNFRPADPIRRAEVAAMLVRALRLEGEQNQMPPYRDAAEIPPWARGAVATASARNLVGGYPDQTFRPEGQATRAEAAAMTSRMLEQMGARYHFFGNLEQTAAGGLQLLMETGIIDLRLNPQTKVYLGRVPGRMADLNRILPRPAYIILAADGTASFIHVPTETMPENAIRLRLAGPGRQVLTSAPGSLWPNGPKSDAGSLAAVFAAPATSPGAAVNSLAVANPLGTVADPSTAANSLAAAAPPSAAASPSAGAPPAAGPGRSLSLTKEEVGAADLAANTGASGRGVVVAVIDTGIDPAHPDFRTQTPTQAKIVDFRDFSGEGLVATQGILTAGQDSYAIGGQQFDLRGLISQGGFFRYGFLEEGRTGIDFNGNRTTTDRFLVVAADPWRAGQYDTVYVDTNGNRSLRDELSMQQFRTTKGYARFPGAGGAPGLAFVVCEINPRGNEVILGFDANGHGTQVAGVIAANGEIRGVAPGAQLLIIKAMDKEGQTNWDQLAQAIRFAADNGARVINLSMANYRDVTAGFNPLTQLVDRITEEKGIVFTIASGNRGPGLASLATPGNARRAIGIGAYITPAMWMEDYGYQVPRETLWYFSSVGPRQDGMMGPTVIAPGSAVTTHPTWMGSNHVLVEGTSIAAAHGAGVVALLLESAARENIAVSPASIRQAIISGARDIKHFSPVEAGAGAIDAAAAWSSLRRLPPRSPILTYTYNRFLGLGEGLYARDFVPGQLSFRMVNQAAESITAFWESTVPWMRAVPRQTLLPPGVEREVRVEYQLPPEPGLYTGLIKGIVPITPGMDIRLMATVVRPYALVKEQNFRQELTSRLEAGQLQRYFFHIPEGTGRVHFNLAVPSVDGRLQGRVRMHLVGPDGQVAFNSDFAGVGPGGTIMHQRVTHALEQPQPGNWEAVVYSSAALSLFGRLDSQYTLSVQASELTPLKPAAPGWLIGVNPRPLTPGKLNHVSLHVRDPRTLHPANTVLEVNGALMEVQGGRLTFPVVPTGNHFEITVR